MDRHSRAERGSYPVGSDDDGNGGAGDGAAARHATRRRVLGWGGAVALGSLAGCRTLPFGTEASSGEFTEDFTDASLANYRTVVGSREQWSIRERGGNPGASVTAAGAFADSLLAPTASVFHWPGTGTIEFTVKPRTDRINRNAIVRFGDVTGGRSWRVKTAFAGDKVKIRAPSGGEQQEPAVIDGEVPRQLRITVDEERVAVSLDGVQHNEFRSPPSLPAGTVAFGLGSNADKGGETWFDDLRFRNE